MDETAWVIQKASVGRYRPDVLALEHRPLAEPGDGDLLVRTLYLSLDPSNLMWLKLLPGWMEEVRIGDVMKGPSLAVVEQSRDPRYAPGDLVTGALHWRTRSVISAADVTPFVREPALSLDEHLSIFSHVGKAALIGMSFVGGVKAGQTVLVSAAAGATGALACQIAKAAGARVVGIAGGGEKCAYLIHDLGLDEAIDYKAEPLHPGLARTCPSGIDLFFDSVGGETLDIALLHLAVGARVAICGAISEYSNAGPAPAYRHANMFQLLMKRARIEGFVVPDFDGRSAELDAKLAELVRRGALKPRMHVLDGLDRAAAGLELLLTGGNHGKLVVKVSDPDDAEQ